jgi:hypothetical protein
MKEREIVEVPHNPVATLEADTSNFIRVIAFGQFPFFICDRFVTHEGDSQKLSGLCRPLDVRHAAQMREKISGQP